MSLRVSGLRKSYRGAVVLDAIDAIFPTGQVCMILAPNGAGKTTFFKCLIGLEDCQGDILLDGRTPDVERNAWYPVFEDAPCHARLTGQQNLRLMVPNASEGDLADHRYLSVEQLHARAGSYSHGERKRLAITAALLSGARCLLWDEPVNGLDVESRSRLRDDILGLKDHGRIQLITGHDFAFYSGLIDRVLVLADGQLVECPLGTSGTLQGEEELLEVYRRYFSFVPA